ncbi:MAG: methylamine utilization protein [Pseudomonadota bacterium]|nr:methylamine utilization protein [Pseudomonadota bacterium]
MSTALPRALAGLAAICAVHACATDLEVHLPAAPDASGLPGVIYLLAAGGHAVAHGASGAVIDQVNRQFVPQVSVIETGAAVTFPNKDNIRHHVYSFSPAKPFELKLYSGRPANPVVFDHAGLVTLGCNIHDVMLGYVLVVDTPYHTVSQADGTAVLHDVPAGDWQLHAWLPGLHEPGLVPRNVHVPPTGKLRIDVSAADAHS